MAQSNCDLGQRDKMVLKEEQKCNVMGNPVVVLGKLQEGRRNVKLLQSRKFKDPQVERDRECSTTIVIELQNQERKVRNHEEKLNQQDEQKLN